LLPLIYLATGLAPFRINSVADMLAFQLPPLLATTALSWNIFRQSRAPIVSAAVNYYLAAKVYPSVVATLFRPFGAPFRVTPKGRPASGDGDHGAFYVIVGLIAASVGCILYGRLNRTTIMETSSYVVATTWAIANLLLLCVMLLCVRPRPRLRGQERFPMQVSGRIHLPGAELPCEVVDLSLTGARITGDFAVAAGSRVDLTLDDVGTIAARVVRYSDRTASLAFNSLEPQVRDRVITTLYASGRSNAPSVVDRIEVLHFLIRRLLFGEA
jgi:cellulose synthase (UDP-forming)